MTEVKWERDRVPGVYKREGMRGRMLFRHVYRNSDGKQVACSKHATVTDARSHQRAMLVSKPTPVVRASLREVYDQRVSDAEASGAPYAPTTLDGHEAAWRYVEHLARVPVGRITTKQVSDALSAVPGPEARVKVRHLLSMLGAPIPTESKPLTRAARMRNGSDAKRPRMLSEDELARIVEEMPERWRAMVQVMAWVGLRPGEAASLRVGDLDSLRRVLTVERAIGGMTKTGHVRDLVLPPVVAEMLVGHIAGFSHPTNPEAPIFPKEDGGAIDTKSSYDAWSRRHFREAAKRADVGDVSPNDLRHMAAARAIASGASVYSVQRMLGHAKPSITLDIYGFLWPSDAEELASKLDERIRREMAQVPTEAQVIRI